MDKIESENKYNHGDFKVVCRCGSTEFKAEFMEAARQEALEGRIPINLACFDKSEPELTSPTREQIEVLVEMHNQKLRMCDEVLVICPDGTLGEATRNEITYAVELDKPIRYTNDLEFSELFKF